jgi:hypothetical protein
MLVVGGYSIEKVAEYNPLPIALANGWSNDRDFPQA